MGGGKGGYGNTKKMKHLDLFSGIGGFALAADRVWGNIEHTFCDIEPFAREVLKKHWPEAKIYEDIRDIKDETADIVTGGFPCQPFSSAGKRKGTADDRHLWPEMFRIICESKPRWVVGENVFGLITWNNGSVLDGLLSDLETEGYKALPPLIIPACAVNAPHRRDRVWIVAYNESSRIRKISDLTREKDSDLNRKDVIITNSGYGTERSPEQGGNEKRPSKKSSRSNKIRANSASSGLERSNWTEISKLQYRNGDENTSWREPWLEVASRLCRVDDGLPKRMDRNPRLKALGNAIVPQIAEQIFKAIKEIR